MEHAEYLKRICFKKNYGNFLITVIILGIGSILLTGVAVVLQEILDIATTGTVQDIYHMLLKVLVYIAILGCNWILERFFRNRFIEKAMRQLKGEIFRSISGKGISAFCKEPTGRYLSILTNDMNSIEMNYLQNNFAIFLNCFYFVAALIIMLRYNIWLTFGAIGLVVVSFIISVLFGGKLTREEKVVSVQNEKFVSLVKDLLNGFSVMKSFKAEAEIVNLFLDENKNLEQKKCRRRKTEASINLIGNCLGFAVQAGVMLLGAYFTMRGRITVGVLMAFVQLMNYIIQPIQLIPPALANRKAAKGLFDKMAEAVADNQEKEAGDFVDNIGQGIYFKNVSFGYDDKQKTLENVTVSFEKGKSYAIVGASGSGKSTLLNLIMGSYTAYDGSITIGGKEVKNILPDSLYDLLSIVQQNVFVFDNSIENNITMFKKFTEEQISDAVEKSGLETLVDEKGLEYRCGENGCELSGGEKQRISIARGFLCKSSILLMDEATSALDAATSVAVENTIIQMKEMTRIVVTHKLNPTLLSRYDEIVVMNKGRIEGRGSYDWLKAQCGYFNQLLQA